MEAVSLTPHILVDCSQTGVIVPKPYVQQGQIVLNIDNGATNALVISNQSITFKARFDGRSESISVPIEAVLSIYAGENGEGMFFEGVTQSIEHEKSKKPNLTLLD